MRLVEPLVERLVYGLVSIGGAGSPSEPAYLAESNYDDFADAYWTSLGYDLSDPADRATASALEEAKLANLGYTAEDASDFEADLFTGNVLTEAAWIAASTTYP